MRRPAVLALLCLAVLGTVAAGPAGAATPAKPKPSWAQPQIKKVVAAGLFVETVPTFAPQDPLSRSALGTALATLASQRGTTTTFAVGVPEKTVTIRELDTALVSFLGLGDSARSVTTALSVAGLAPKSGTGTETVARLLGLRINHPAAEDALELGPNDPATRAEAAFSLARVLDLTSGWEEEQVRNETSLLALPVLTTFQRDVLRRAVSFVGYPYVWGGTSELPQQLFGKPVPGGFDCSGFVWRVFKLQPFPGASALASVLRGRTTYEMSGEVPLAQRIRKVENLQPGDVIFQGDQGPASKPAQVGHAGIYVGGGWFVHSSGNGTTLHPFDGWYRARFAWARRPLREAGLS